MVNSASRYQSQARDFIIKFAGEKDGQVAMFKAGEDHLHMLKHVP